MIHLRNRAATLGPDQSEPRHGSAGRGQTFREQTLPRSRGKGRKVFPRHLETEIAGPQGAGLTGRGR